MNDIDIFDVIIVYSDLVANSASSAESCKKPFPSSKNGVDLNKSYSYLLEMCAENNLKAAFTTSGDITGAGTAGSYWVFADGKWSKVKRSCYAGMIFDKFFPRDNESILNRGIMLSSKNVSTFSNKNTQDLFFDKYNTFKKLSNYSSPTVKIADSQLQSAENAVLMLKNLVLQHPNNSDFSEDFIMKDRFGAGGKNIYKIISDYAQNISEIARANKDIYFILQPFVKFDVGFRFEENLGQTEIRLIFKGDEIFQTYIRVSGKIDFICNNGNGDIRIPIDEIPKSVIKMARKIAKNMKSQNEIFALDFIISNENNVYLLEGNSSPGIAWDRRYPDNEVMCKEIINQIVSEMSRRTSQKINNLN